MSKERRIIIYSDRGLSFVFLHYHPSRLKTYTILWKMLKSHVCETSYQDNGTSVDE